MKRKTKTVATVSPNALKDNLLGKMIEAGVDVFRLNFSHGNHLEHREIIETIKKLRKGKSKPVAILQDLSGSKIRIGDFNTPEITLASNQIFTFSTNKETEGSSERVFVDYPKLPEEILKGDRIVLDDGRVNLEVIDITENEIKCLVLQGAKIRGRRGLTVPGRKLSLPVLSEKDKNDVLLGLELEVDFIALSFVQSEECIKTLRSFINESTKGPKPDIIAKIETKNALDSFDSILDASDAVMVARGDLAIDILPEEVPMAQKNIITKANKAGKPVITATQMLESMINSPKPTRAETSDVANAILDGTDAVMLSGETSIGRFPLQAIDIIQKTAEQIEKNYPVSENFNYVLKKEMEVVNAVTKAVVKVSNDVEAKLIVALTDSGFTGRMISRFKPRVFIMALATDKRSYRKLALSFGCIPIFVESPENISTAFDLVRQYVERYELAKEGDRVVVTAGVPFDVLGVKTNMLSVETL
jgi:pyruvate kinase